MRVAPHVHSDWSYDGRWTLEQLARAFARRGYDAVLMAEHDRTFDAERWAAYRAACAAASARGALLVPGIEYSDAANGVHVPVWGVDEFLGAGRPTAALLEDVRARDGVAVIAHPKRRDVWRDLPDATVALAHGVEIWNRKYDGWAPSAEALALARRAGLPHYVGLDFHTARQFFPLALAGRGETAGDPGAVVDALRDGRLAPTALRLQAARVSRGRGLAAAQSAERARRALRSAARQARRAASR